MSQPTFGDNILRVYYKRHKHNRGGIILAGGSSSRFGKNKALIMFSGKALIRHVVDNCIGTIEQLVVTIGKEEDPAPFFKVLPPNIQIVQDRWEYKNPLNGISTGIKFLDAEYCLVLPCDTPYIKPGVLNILFQEVYGFDLAVPIWPNGYIEPLVAVYKVESTIEALRSIGEYNKSRVDRLVSSLKRVKHVNVEIFTVVDPHLISFLNINSPSDLRLAEEANSGRFANMQQH
ncbi:MAG: molybdenum cofactor guanylyltransferase [Candidatus Bathyarchaeia archaeon]